MRELREQSDVAFDYLFTASSGACTQAGMLLGKQLFGFDGLKIFGVSPDEPSEDVRGAVRKILGAAGELLEFAGAENVTVLTDYAGAGYCHETDAAQEALKLLARVEGIMLDSVYTAKAMAALLDWVRQGRFAASDNMLFWHTGGQLGLFYA
jgi:1-aminocyclopropane-1-carboxylate deaminase/D-cysteine desulfhydrase-like pyridoxal-dependent ACC family enzyme